MMDIEVRCCGNCPFTDKKVTACPFVEVRYQAFRGPDNIQRDFDPWKDVLPECPMLDDDFCVHLNWEKEDE